MPRETIIYERNGWRLTSYGNGAAYLLEDVAQHKSVFFQYGDDASTFRAEYIKAQGARRDPERATLRLFSDYAEVMS